MATQSWPWHPAHRSAVQGRRLTCLSQHDNFRWVVLILLVFVMPCGMGHAAESLSPLGLVVPVDGEPFQGRFVQADEAWEWTFADGQERKSMPAGEVVRWGTPVEPVRGPIVVTADGGLLPADVRRLHGGKALLESDSLGVMSVPLEAMAGIVLSWPEARVARDRLVDRLLHFKGSSDRVILTNGDLLDGVVAKIDNNHVFFEGDNAPTTLARDRVAAVVFHPALRTKPEESGFRVWVGLADGTRLLVNRLVLNETTVRLRPSIIQNQAQTKTTTKTPWWSAAARQCVFVQPLKGRAVYLSDRQANGYRHVPFLDLPWGYHNDRNVLGQQLRSGGQTYLKGLGVHSSARLTYQLDEPFDRFEAALALDDAAGRGGSVRYHIFVDGHRRFSTDPIQGGDRPVPIRVDLTGAKRLDLIIDFGQWADQLDYANWLDARLIRPDVSPRRHAERGE